MESEHGDRTQRGYAIEREVQENREKLNTLALDLDRAAPVVAPTKSAVLNSMRAPPERKPRSPTREEQAARCSRN